MVNLLSSRNWKKVKEADADKGWKGKKNKTEITGQEKVCGFYFECDRKSLQVLSRKYYMILFANNNFVNTVGNLWLGDEQNRNQETNLDTITKINQMIPINIEEVFKWDYIKFSYFFCYVA
jgi:hypothetical protein